MKRALAVPPFELGMSTVPCGKRGPWEISEFTIEDGPEMLIFNLRSMRDDGGVTSIKPGTYKRLTHEKRGVVMSNTPMEVRTNREAWRLAHGRVLINGLGMGMLVEALLHKPEVNYIRIIEVDADVIALVGDYVQSLAKDGRVDIIHADAHEYQPAKHERFNYVWHDIWDTISEENLPAMERLARRYSTRRADGQGFWSRDLIRQQQARGRRAGW